MTSTVHPSDNPTIQRAFTVAGKLFAAGLSDPELQQVVINHPAARERMLEALRLYVKQELTELPRLDPQRLERTVQLFVRNVWKLKDPLSPQRAGALIKPGVFDALLDRLPTIRQRNLVKLRFQGMPGGDCMAGFIELATYHSVTAETIESELNSALVLLQGWVDNRIELLLLKPEIIATLLQCGIPTITDLASFKRGDIRQFLRVLDPTALGVAMASIEQQLDERQLRFYDA